MEIKCALVELMEFVELMRMEYGEVNVYLHQKRNGGFLDDELACVTVV